MWRRPLEWNLNGTTDPRDGSVDHLSLNSLKDRHGPIRAPKSVNAVLGELIAGIAEVAIIGGITQIVGVFDARVYRVLKAAGCNPQLIGRPQRIEETMSYVGLFDTGNSPLETIRNAIGIKGS